MGVRDWFKPRAAQPARSVVENDILGHLPAPMAREPARSGGLQHRQYAAARSSRLTSGWTTENTSADTQIASSLTSLRARSRALVRDASYARRARELVVNNVIGTGMGMQAQVRTTRGDLNQRVNDDIEKAWRKWSCADSCHTGGRLHFRMLERQAVGQVFEAGEVFIRKHYRRFGRSEVPFALELIEGERLADEYISTHISAQQGVEVRMGVEVDEFHRPLAYWIRSRHPSEYRFATTTVDHMERIPADQIIHLAVLDRFPQSRGIPWLHTAMRRVADMDGYSEAEITRARVQAATPWTIETPNDVENFGEIQTDGSVEMDVEPGVAKRLNPGEKMNAPSATAPNPALDGFMRYMIREIAAGIGVSYESLSRDYSQSNYSSSRLALLDDRDVWRFLQTWFITDFRELIHREWLSVAVLSRAIPSIPADQYAADIDKFEAVRFKPRGWSWVDPTKEVAAYKEAIMAGLTTNTDVIAATAGGLDIEDVLDQREQELELMRERGLVFDTSPEVYDKPEPAPAPAAPAPDTAEADPEDDPEAEDADDDADPADRRYRFQVIGH